MNFRIEPVDRLTKPLALFGLVWLLASMICLAAGNSGFATALFVVAVGDLALTGILVGIGALMGRTRNRPINS